MRIYIHQIPYEGLKVTDEIAAEELELELEDFKCEGPFKVEALIEKTDNMVLAKMKVVGHYELTCGQCLEPVKRSSTEKFTLYFDITQTTQYVDLKEDLRQELVIAFSPLNLVRFDPKGKCPDCGKDLPKEPQIWRDKKVKGSDSDGVKIKI